MICLLATIEEDEILDAVILGPTGAREPFKLDAEIVALTGLSRNSLEGLIAILLF